MFAFFALLVLSYSLLQTHPINTALGLLLVSVLAALALINLVRLWLGLSLALIFTGGIIIIILYVRSLASENKLAVGKSLSPLLTLPLFLRPSYLSSSMGFFQDHPLFSLYLNLSGGPLLLLLLYLLLRLITVVNISENFQGPVARWH